MNKFIPIFIWFWDVGQFIDRHLATLIGITSGENMGPKNVDARAQSPNVWTLLSLSLSISSAYLSP